MLTSPLPYQYGLRSHEPFPRATPERYTGSPESLSYAPFCAHLASLSNLPILAVDYPLLPNGTVDEVLAQIGRALHWLHTHEPRDMVTPSTGGGESETKGGVAPRILIVGDSSGGGSAASALLAQAQGGLEGAGEARLSGAVL